MRCQEVLVRLVLGTSKSKQNISIICGHNQNSNGSVQVAVDVYYSNVSLIKN